MNAPGEPSDPQEELNRLTTLVTPWAVRVAATLRLADHVTEGPATVDDLASETGCDADALRRLLRFLAVHGVFEAVGDDRYGPTPISRLLEDAGPGSQRAWLDLEGAGGNMDRAWMGLLDAVLTGRPAYDAVFGRGFWEDLDANPVLRDSFNGMMGGHSQALGPELASALDWSGAQRVVDVGGGSGVMLSALLQAQPHLRGILVDLPATAAAARAALNETGVADRCDVVAGSFFDEIPAGADAYVLSWILHDWPDDDAVRILQRCREAAGARGKILVIEYVASGHADAALVAAMDLRMLALFASRERTLAQFDELAEHAGLARRATHETGMGLSVLEYATSG